MTYHFYLSRWDYESRSYIPVGEAVMCHDHRQMFLESAYHIVSAWPAINATCLICEWQEKQDRPLVIKQLELL